uniref:NADH deshydrogenase subunit 4L n=1 Tax=Habrodera capensis TaxID=175592 RepID=A0A0S2MRB4_9CARA|nr:NADH deshydrogenase subunit 4L [Habrodera capensis]
MYLMFILFFSMMFFSGMFVFCLKRKHLLLMLLSLEYMILSLYMLMFINMSMYDYELSILVSLIRTHGNDLFFSMNILC